MKRILKLIIIGIIGGTVLAEMLRMIYLVTGINAYNLLFNFDYLPFIGQYSQTDAWTGMLFHYFTCVMSVLVSYYIFKKYGIQKDVLPYVVLFLIGSLILFFLTGLSPELPEWNDWSAFIFFGFGHLVYGLVVGKLIQELIDEYLFL